MSGHGYLGLDCHLEFSIFGDAFIALLLCFLVGILELLQFSLSRRITVKKNQNTSRKGLNLEIIMHPEDLCTESRIRLKLGWELGKVEGLDCT